MVRLILWAAVAAMTLTATAQDASTCGPCKIRQKSFCPDQCMDKTKEAEFCPYRINVSDKTKTLKYFPEEPDEFLCPGRKVEFAFFPANHTVTESSFDEPCKLGGRGFKTGFMPVSLNDSSTTVPAKTYVVQDLKPVWFYCGQTGHCPKGMVMAINVNKCNGSNPEKNLDAYKKKAASLLSTTATTSSTTAQAPGVTPTDTATAAGPALGTPTPTTSLVSVFRGQAAPTAAPAVRYGAWGGLAIAGAVALL